MVSVNMFDRVRVVNDFVIDDFWLRELEDHHRSGHYEGEESKRHCLPCFQSNQCQCEWNENGCLELQAKQEGNHNFLNEATACE